MKKIYKEPKMILELAEVNKAVMLNTSDTPADPTQPVLGKDRDEFDEDMEIIQILEEQNSDKKTLW